MKTGEVCKREVVTCFPGASLVDVAKLMREHHVGSVVVVGSPGSAVPVGIITDRDIVVEAVAPSLDTRTLTAEEIMSRNPVTSREEDDADWALKVMRDRGIRRLPVVNGAGELQGIVAFDDLLEVATSALADAVQAIGTERVMEGLRRRVKV